MYFILKNTLLYFFTHFLGRDRLGVISSCFSQLCHKAQTLAQMNAKLEAEIVNLRTELFNQTAKSRTHTDEAEKLVLQLHQEQVKKIVKKM